MYLLFRWHNILPGQFYSLGMGEKSVLYAFVKQEEEERRSALNGS